jgi:hypothetical protein
MFTPDRPTVISSADFSVSNTAPSCHGPSLEAHNDDRDGGKCVWRNFRASLLPVMLDLFEGLARSAPTV